MNVSKKNQWGLFIFVLLFSLNVFAVSKNIVNAVRKFFDPSRELRVSNDSNELLEQWVKDNVNPKSSISLMNDLKRGSGHEQVMDEIYEVVLMVNHVGVVNPANRRTYTQMVRAVEQPGDFKILDDFKVTFRAMDKDSELYENCKKIIFERWWLDENIRAILFVLMTKEDLSNPYHLLKWWEFAKANRYEHKLADAVVASIRAIKRSDEVSWGDSCFYDVVIRTTREDRGFARDWKALVEETPALAHEVQQIQIGRRRVSEMNHGRVSYTPRDLM